MATQGGTQAAAALPIDIDTLSFNQFAQLPLVIRGASKEVRYAGRGMVVLRYLPTIYSFTHNRCAKVAGSDTLRMRAMQVFLQLFEQNGIKHAYVKCNERFALAHLVVPHASEYDKYGLPEFVPDDLTDAEFDALPRGPPIEVIVKTFHGGTSKHRYLGMSGAHVRPSHPLFANFGLDAEQPYPEPLVRFDWRNPLEAGIEHQRRASQRAKLVAKQVLQVLDASVFDVDKDDAHIKALYEAARDALVTHRKRVADEILPEPMADWFIDVAAARATALRAHHALQAFLASCDIVCNDLCLFITEDGSTVYGELSPDCGRFRHFDLGSLDKDVWRSGGSSDDVLAKWTLLCDMLEKRVRRADLPARLPSLPPPPPPPSKTDAAARPAPLDLWLGTGNPHKVSEIASICAHLPIRLRVCTAVGGQPEPDEPFETFQGNARAKALAYAERCGGLTVAEDSGLCVAALNGLPGPWSARFDDAVDIDWSAGKVVRVEPSGRTRDALDAANCAKLLRSMPPQSIDDGSPCDRSATFCVALAVAVPGRILFEAYEEVRGRVAKQLRGSAGFGYDPLFIGQDTNNATFAELDGHRKNLRSHRTKVVHALAAWLTSSSGALTGALGAGQLPPPRLSLAPLTHAPAFPTRPTRTHLQHHTVIGMCIGRPRRNGGTAALLKCFFDVEPHAIMPFDGQAGRCCTYIKHHVAGQRPLAFVDIKSRDAAKLLQNGTIDMAIAFDDAPQHLNARNYALKPLAACVDPRTMRLCDIDLATDRDCAPRIAIVARHDFDPSNTDNVIATEFGDAARRLQRHGIAAGTTLSVSGTAESLVSNGVADAAIVIVESGETLRANRLRVVASDTSPVELRAWVNTLTPVGLELFHRHPFRASMPLQNPLLSLDPPPPLAGIVYVEGIDGVGKSTLVRRLCGEARLWPLAIVDRSEHVTHVLTMQPADQWPATFFLEHKHTLPFFVLLLDADDVDFCQRNICARENTTPQQLEQDPFESRDKLLHFRDVYRALASKYAAHFRTVALTADAHSADYVFEKAFDECVAFLRSFNRQ